MMRRNWFKKSFIATIFAISLLVGAASAFANPIINENAKGPGGYSITQTYFNYDNYGFMEGGPPMDSWKFTSSGTSATLNFSVDTAGASAGFVIFDTTYSGTSTYVSGASSITPGNHTYALTLIASHNYTIYVQPTGSITYNYHFTLS